MTQRAAFRRLSAACRRRCTSSTVYGTTSSSSRRGALAMVAGFTVRWRRRTASLRAARTVRWAWWAVPAALPLSCIFL